MERLDQASRHMSNARRHLIAADRNGAAFDLAVAEARLALAAIGTARLDSDEIGAWVQKLRDAVDGGAADTAQFMDAVDELASRLFFRELATA